MAFNLCFWGAKSGGSAPYVVQTEWLTLASRSWLVVGDFNEAMWSFEHSSVTPVSLNLDFMY